MFAPLNQGKDRTDGKGWDETPYYFPGRFHAHPSQRPTSHPPDLTSPNSSQSLTRYFHNHSRTGGLTSPTSPTGSLLNFGSRPSSPPPPPTTSGGGQRTNNRPIDSLPPPVSARTALLGAVVGASNGGGSGAISSGSSGPTSPVVGPSRGPRRSRDRDNDFQPRGRPGLGSPPPSSTSLASKATGGAKGKGKSSRVSRSPPPDLRRPGPRMRALAREKGWDDPNDSRDSAFGNKGQKLSRQDARARGGINRISDPNSNPAYPYRPGAGGRWGDGVGDDGEDEEEEERMRGWKGWLVIWLRPSRKTVEKWLDAWWRRWAVLVLVPSLLVWIWCAVPFPVSNPYDPSQNPWPPNWEWPHGPSESATAEMAINTRNPLSTVNQLPSCDSPYQHSSASPSFPEGLVSCQERSPQSQPQPEQQQQPRRSSQRRRKRRKSSSSREGGIRSSLLVRNYLDLREWFRRRAEMMSRKNQDAMTCRNDNDHGHDHDAVGNYQHIEQAVKSSDGKRMRGKDNQVLLGTEIVQPGISIGERDNGILEMASEQGMTIAPVVEGKDRDGGGLEDKQNDEDQEDNEDQEDDDDGNRDNGDMDDDAKLPVDANFYFFLFFYFGLYLAAGLLFITKMFDLYRLNWWPKFLGGSLSYGFFWTFSICLGIIMHQFDAFHIRQRHPHKPPPDQNNGTVIGGGSDNWGMETEDDVDWERKTLWVSLAFVTMSGPAFACFGKLRGDRRQSYRNSFTEVQKSFLSSQLLAHRMPRSYIRFLWFLLCLAIALASLLAGQAYAAIYLSTLPHSSLDGVVYVWSWIITVQVLALITGWLLESKVRSRALGFLFRYYYFLVYFVFYRNLFARLRSPDQFVWIQLVSSSWVIILYPLMMSSIWWRTQRFFTGSEKAVEDHREGVAQNLYLRNLSENVTMFSFLGWLTILHFGPNSQIYPFFDFKSSHDPYNYRLTATASLVIWATELGSSFLARLACWWLYGVDVTNVGLGRLRDHPELVTACIWASVHVLQDILFFLIKLNFR